MEHCLTFKLVPGPRVRLHVIKQQQKCMSTVFFSKLKYRSLFLLYFQFLTFSSACLVDMHVDFTCIN